MSSSRLGVGLVGAGEIARAGHLPAYGANPQTVELRGIFDVDPSRRELFAEAAGVPAVEGIERLLEDPAVDLVDIAVPPGAQPEIVMAALEAGKHVLAQKPLAVDLDSAAELVAAAELYGRVLAVNQQMRWAPAILDFRRFADGRSVESASFDLVWPIERGDGLPSWLADAPRFVGLFNSIHFLDTSRWLFGEPREVRAWLGPADIPGIVGESALYAIIRFEGLSVTIRDTRRPEGRHTASLRAATSDGLFFGHLGIWDAYPDPSPDHITQATAGSDPSYSLSAASWVPDAFAKSLRHVAEAILSGRQPCISGRDNLKTLRLVEACYHSAERHGRPVPIPS